jgi:hypothetical protein
MDVSSVPSGAAELDAGWLTEALGPVADGARVTAVDARRIGTGQVAESLRLSLSWDRPGPAPTTVVAKVPSGEEASRAAATATRTYEIEAAFYAELAGSVAVHRPACYCSRYDPGTGDYVVLLEDLAPAVPGDQIAGCTPEEAAATMPELAALHAPRWGDEALEDLAWLDHPTEEAASFTGELVGALWPGFVDRYGDRVDPDVVALGERFVPRLADWLRHRPRPWTVTHGDFRVDNLLFGGRRVAVVDWQTVHVGPAGADVGYFLGTSLDPDARARHEETLVRAYHAELTARGVDQTWSDCWDGYRSAAFSGLVMGVAASMLVTRTDRGDEMFLAMANRVGRQCLELGSESLLPG